MIGVLGILMEEIVGWVRMGEARPRRAVKIGRSCMVAGKKERDRGLPGGNLTESLLW